MAKSISLILMPSKSGRAAHKRKSSKTKSTKRVPKSKNSVRAFGSRKYKRGSFKRYCTKKGFKGANDACVAHGLKSSVLLRRKQANLVKTLNRIRPKKQ